MLIPTSFQRLPLRDIPEWIVRDIELSNAYVDLCEMLEYEPDPVKLSFQRQGG